MYPGPKSLRGAGLSIDILIKVLKKLKIFSSVYRKACLFMQKVYDASDIIIKLKKLGHHYDNNNAVKILSNIK